MNSALLTTQNQALRRASTGRATGEPNRFGTEILELIQELTKSRILSEEQIQQFCKKNDAIVRDAHTRERFCQALLAAKLISQYQMGRILAKQTSSLIFGNYLLLDRLAAGTVGVVFKAEHLFVGRHVAIKMLNADGETPTKVIDRFHYEGRLLGQVTHPNVVEVLDAGSAPALDGSNHLTHYLALEFLDGSDVEDYVYAKNEPLEVEETCDLMSQVAWGLAAIHEKGILHRDIKPSNLLMSSKGDVKIVDFGIGLDTKNRFKYNENLLGSLDFMPLEQSIDPEQAIPASDVYALGVTCFWLLTGQTPLPQAKTVEDALMNIREGQFRRIKQYRNDVPAELEGSIMRMLERDPRRRLGAARDAAVLLERFSRRRLVKQSPAEGGNSASVSTSNMGKPTAADTNREEGIYRALAMALELKDSSGPQRGKRLNESLNEICRVLVKREPWGRELDETMLKTLSWAVRLLDVAMLFLPDRLFTSRTLLTRDELEILRRHPISGAEFLEKLVREVETNPVLFKSLAKIVECHHERQDGSGTPQSLKADDIPAGARIASVIDTYEGLRRSTKSRVGISHEEAIRQIIQERAAQFDPWVLIAFQECEAKISSIYANYPDSI